VRTLNDRELDELAQEYTETGFAYARQMFTADELAPLAGSLVDGAAPGGFSVPDSLGGKQELSVWLELGDDLIGVIPRLEPIVEIAERLIGGDVYHWHSKLSWKRPHAESLWDWHQDFPFWGREGVERSDMCTIAVAIGPVFEANGCMRLVPGSHLLGPIDVVELGESQGSDPADVQRAVEQASEELCEMEPGDVVVFHSNTLHSSGPNESDVPRTILMSSYNAVSNPPTKPESPYALRPLNALPVSALADGWNEVFGDTRLIDPSADGLGQGYATEPVDQGTS